MLLQEAEASRAIDGWQPGAAATASDGCQCNLQHVRGHATESI